MITNVITLTVGAVTLTSEPLPFFEAYDAFEAACEQLGAVLDDITEHPVSMRGRVGDTVLELRYVTPRV